MDGHRVELGYVLARAFWGNGYMPEAARAIVTWALNQPETYWVLSGRVQRRKHRFGQSAGRKSACRGKESSGGGAYARTQAMSLVTATAMQ